MQVKPSTVKAIRSKFNKILPKFSKMDMKSISSAYCQKVINEWSEEVKTFKDYKIQANLVFKYAYKLGYISMNPMDRITLPKSRQDYLVSNQDDMAENFYTREELLDFLNCINDMPLNLAFFHLLASTGARKGEILALTGPV